MSNSNETYDYCVANYDTSSFRNALESLPPVFVPFAIIYLFCSLSIFPAYLYVFNKNWQQDQKSAVFPIIHHFHWFSKIFQLSVSVLSILIILLLYFRLEWLDALALGYLTIWFLGTAFAVEVNQYLLSLLAIQRFLLYFFPGTDAYLNFTKKSMRNIIYIAYGFSTAEFLVYCCFFLKSGANHAQVFFIIYYTSVNSLLLLSALLYIPIVISIFKLSHLPSVELNQPQTFVMWQLVAVLLQKSIYIPLFLLCRGHLSSTMNDCKSFDVLLVPLLIQLTYLGCNKRTFETIPIVMKMKKTFRATHRFLKSENADKVLSGFPSNLNLDGIRQIMAELSFGMTSSNKGVKTTADTRHPRLEIGFTSTTYLGQ